MKIVEGIKILLDASNTKTGRDVAKKSFDDISQAGKKMKRELDSSGKSLDRAGESAKRASGPLSRLARDAKGLVATFAGIAGARAVITTLSDFESGVVGVEKTTSNLDLGAFQADILALGQSLPVTAGSLLEITQAAGQLGVANEDLLAFTETIGQLGLASDLSGESAAKTLARLINVVGESNSQIGAVGAVITRLGNEFAATESEIATVATRVAQTTASFGVGSTEALAYGAALQSVGVEAELAGGTLGRTFRSIDKSVREGGEALAAVANIAGTTAESFAQIFGEDRVQGLQLVLEGVQAIGQAGGSTAEALNSVGVSASRDIGVLQTLANRADILADALDTANDELGKQTALTEEVGKRSQTLASRYDILKNSLTGLTVSTGDSGLLDTLKGVTDVLAESVNRVSGLSDEIPDASDAVEGLATAVTTLGTALAFSFGASQLRNLVKGVGLLGALRGAALGPAGLIGAGVGLAAFGLPDLLSESRLPDPLAPTADRIGALRDQAIGASIAGDLELQKQAESLLEQALRNARAKIGGIDGELNQQSLEAILGDDFRELYDSLRQAAFDAFREAVESGDQARIEEAASRLQVRRSPGIDPGSATVLPPVDRSIRPSDLDVDPIFGQSLGANGVTLTEIDKNDVLGLFGQKVEETKERVEDLDKAIDGLGESGNAEQQARLISGLEEEISLIGLTEEQLRRLSIQNQAAALTSEQLTEADEKFLAQTRILSDELEERIATQQKLEQLGDLAGDAFSTIANGLFQGAEAGREFRDVLEDIGRELANLAAQQLIRAASNAIASGISGAGGGGDSKSIAGGGNTNSGAIPGGGSSNSGAIPGGGSSNSGATVGANSLNVTLNINGGASPETARRLTQSSKQIADDISRRLQNR